MKTSLPSALVYGINDNGSIEIKSNLYHEERLVEVVHAHLYETDQNIDNDLVNHNPDVIITVGQDKQSFEGVLRASENNLIRSKVIHLTSQPEPTELANIIVKASTDWACSVNQSVYQSNELPYFSIFTPAYKTEDRIFRAYDSLKNQTYQNWEWIIVDDSPQTHLITWGILQGIANKDHRVKICRMQPVSGGNIGEVKRRATSMANAKWLLELDHDDALMPTCLEDISEAILANPKAGFFYTDVAEPYEDGTMRKYTKTIGTRDEWYANKSNTFVWAYGGHEWVDVDGTNYLCHVYPEINPKTIRFNIGMPNHARVWRQDVYEKIGKHNRFISVADDYELIVKTFLETEMVHIRKMLYLQYNNRNSTVDNNVIDINRKARLIRDHYDKAIHNRIIELGKHDWNWNEQTQRSSPFQNDMENLRYYEEESVLSKTFTPGQKTVINQIQNMKKPSHIKICMNAMVGNEENTIVRMLESVVGYIDYYVIQCNGKKDNTRQIIDNFFAERGIPGFTYEIDWDYPGWNRDHTLQTALKADHGCDWILRMDADEQLKVEEDFNWSIFENTSIDSFNMVADPGDSLYFRTWFWNARRPWFFAHDRRHETIHLPEIGENFQRVNLDRGFRHIITNDGDTWLAPMKFLNDALELERDKVVSNLVLEDSYHLWYIAKSYSDAYGNSNEFPFGMEHAREYARRCIFYFNMYLNQIHDYASTGQPKNVDDMAYYGMLLIGNAYAFLGENVNAIESFRKAEAFNPRRNEAMYRMAELYEKLGMFNDMLATTSKLIDESRTNPFPSSSFLIHNSAYFDSNPLPFWLHAKALKAVLEKDGQLRFMAETLNALRLRLLKNHPGVENWILEEFKVASQEPIQTTQVGNPSSVRSFFNADVLNNAIGTTI